MSTLNWILRDKQISCFEFLWPNLMSLDKVIALFLVGIIRFY